ncbi:hypothetical protein ACIBCB_33675 [Streptomyces uncialis]|uniref:hypothetical protein n=1 Tax=Streptomyces uncialis TaxID=1048205 RepID=UPI00379A29FC
MRAPASSGRPLTDPVVVRLPSDRPGLGREYSDKIHLGSGKAEDTLDRPTTKPPPDGAAPPSATSGPAGQGPEAGERSADGRAAGPGSKDAQGPPEAVPAPLTAAGAPRAGRTPPGPDSAA